MSGTINGTWKCKDCGAGIDYTAIIVGTETIGRGRRIRAVIENDADLRAHAESHGYDGGTQPLVVIVEVAL